jgi:hypothetical protein
MIRNVFEGRKKKKVLNLCICRKVLDCVYRCIFLENAHWSQDSQQRIKAHERQLISAF